jgi:hypothetical protein
LANIEVPARLRESQAMVSSMSSFYDSQIDRIAHGLIDRSLPQAEWTHAAHFAAALYHETITLAIRR